jgi:hypothetical protein
VGSGGRGGAKRGDSGGVEKSAKPAPVLDSEKGKESARYVPTVPTTCTSYTKCPKAYKIYCTYMCTYVRLFLGPLHPHSESYGVTVFLLFREIRRLLYIQHT